jgi:hypothetical protein
MNLKPVIKTIFPLAIVFALSAGAALAGTATSVSGLYYSGVNNSGGLLAGGTTDPHWSVTYASTNGGSSANAAYEGAAYVVSASNVSGSSWASNTSSAQWITAPGATNSSGGNKNTGGDYLPGTGTGVGSNEGIYYYTLSFTVNGTGSGAVTNQTAISLTIAADDQYSIYVNPTFNANGTIDTTNSTLAASATAAWSNTQVSYLQNYGNGNSNANANFVIGTNKIVIEVDNTNSKTGNVADSINASGLLVYQVGSSATSISSNPVPEVGAWLPVALAVGLFGWRRWRSKETAALSVA